MAVGYLTNPKQMRIANSSQSVAIRPKLSAAEKKQIEQRAVERAMKSATMERKNPKRKKNGLRNPNIKSIAVQSGYAVLGAAINGVASRVALNMLPGQWRRRRLAGVGVQLATAIAIGFAAEKIVGKGQNADAVTIGAFTLPANTLFATVMSSVQQNMSREADAVDDLGNVLQYDQESRRYYLSDGTPYDGD
jgi:hypothetical protein